MKTQEAVEMTPQEVLSGARKFISEFRGPFMMATVSNRNQPRIRWMGAMVFEEPFTLYLETFVKSRKVDDLRANPDIQLLLSKQDFSMQLILTGKARMEESAQKKSEVWSKIPASGDYFRGPDDTDFGVIKLAVSEVELWTSADQRRPFTASL